MTDYKIHGGLKINNLSLKVMVDVTDKPCS